MLYYINISKIFMKYFSFFFNYFNIICYTYIFQFSKIVYRMKKIMEIKWSKYKSQWDLSSIILSIAFNGLGVE